MPNALSQKRLKLSQKPIDLRFPVWLNQFRRPLYRERGVDAVDNLNL